MPNARVRTTDSPTGRLRTTDSPTGAIRTTDNPTGLIRTTDSPTGFAKYSGILASEIVALNFAGKGYLIGMLALTYSKVQTRGALSTTFKSDDIPIGRIRTTD